MSAKIFLQKKAGLFFAALAAVAGSASAAENPARHLMQSLHDVTGVPGFSAAVSKGDKIVWTGSVGTIDAQTGRPVFASAKFRLASVSKLFAAALVLNLAEEGVLDLDADIRAYTPEWPEHGGAVITLRHLAAHISGLGHYSAEDRFNPDAGYENLRDSISIYAHKPLLSQPGDSYAYSSYGYALMGAAVEAATGQSFDAALADRILSPLGLTNTFIEDNDFLPEGASGLFAADGGGFSEIERNSQHHVRGATGMLSTPTDLLRFADAYEAGEIVSASMRDMSWTPAQLNDGRNAGEERFDVGFGWRIGADWEGRPVYHHAGTTPGARTILSVNPDADTSVALLSNAQWISRIETTGELLATAATEGEALEETDCPDGAWRYRGRFIENRQAPPETDNAAGEILIAYSDGVCTGRIEPDGSISNWLEGRNAKLPYIPLTLSAQRGDGTSIFAMATPWGAFPLRLGIDDAAITARGDIAGRVIELVLTPVEHGQVLD